ncbi:testis-specific gene A8 protein-like [Dermacentor silvarum]|uniref:testis-specific gene A8 protein-like n=1 Tax=Dermacentor silvarum TaxID=543639 RepID=UPI002100E556|nr:testis-specific gene A8 protein-like [Dermacentor silvarum]
MREGQPEEADPARSGRAADTALSSSGGASRQASPSSWRGRAPPDELLRRRSRVGTSPTTAIATALDEGSTQPHQRQGLFPLSPDVPSTADADRTASCQMTLRQHSTKGRKRQPKAGFEQTLATFSPASLPSPASPSAPASPLSPTSLMSPIPTSSASSPSSTRPGYGAGALLHEGLGAPEQDATSGQGSRRMGRAKYWALHGADDREEKKRPTASDSRAAGSERTEASHHPPTRSKQRQREGVKNGAKTAQDMGFTTSKIRRPIGGAGTSQEVGVIIGSGQMAPAGTAASNRNTMASHDQQPEATEVKERDLGPAGPLD